MLIQLCLSLLFIVYYQLFVKTYIFEGIDGVAITCQISLTFGFGMI